MSRLMSWFRERGERGVTVVEYSLVISLVVVGSLSSLEGLDGELEKHYTETANDIGEASSHAFDVTTTTIDPSSTTTSTTTSTTSTTSTTAPASSTTTTTTTTTTAPASSTTTTTTTTTTTAPTTTTTSGGGGGASPPATTTIPGADDAEVHDRNWSDYYDGYGWNVYGRLRFYDDSDNYLSYASVTYTVTLASGEQQTFSGTTDNRGRIYVDWYPVPGSHSFPATVTVTSVTDDGESFNPDPAEFVWDL